MTEASVFERTELCDGVILYQHRSSRWKSELVHVVFPNRFENLAARALATSLLRHGSSHRRGMDVVARYLQDSFGAGLGSYVARSHVEHLLVMRATAVAAKWLPRKLDALSRTVSLARSELHRPWFALSTFPPELFAVERDALVRQIDAIRDNTPQYAFNRLVEEMFACHELALQPHGRRDEVEALERGDVAAAFAQALTSGRVLIHVVSPRSRRDVRRMVEDGLRIPPRAARPAPRYVPPPIRRRARTVREARDVAQGRLALGFRIADYDRNRDARPGYLADVVLGGDASSRLFKVVRERHSLAYAIGSSFDPKTGTVYVTAGLDTDAFDPALKMIKREVRSIASGAVGDAERDVALRTIEKSIANAHDSPGGLVGFYMGRHLEGKRGIDRETLLRRYRRVTKGQMADVFSRLRLDTVFRLEREGESR